VPPKVSPAPRSAPPPEPARITSRAQACEILGIPFSATLKQAKSAYRARMMDFHSDRVQHLGKELRDLAHRKSVEINLAWQFIQKG
jgi:preprotein translocase subunit Sec63